MDNLDFSEEEIQEQLAVLGYKNIPKHRLLEFKKDLDELIQHGEWKTLSSTTQINRKSQTVRSQPSPPAYTKEKVSRCYFEGCDDGFFLHASRADSDRQVLTTCQNTDYGQQQADSRHCDSYAQHSVAPKLRLPPGAPGRLQTEPDVEDTLHSPLSDSYTSSPDTEGRRFIKRKVLRKHKGQSFVCDESIYSEDSALCLLRSHTSAEVRVATMYKTCNTQWDNESEDDKNSLNSSFWSDGEKQEEEEEVEIERVIESKPADDTKDTVQEASEEDRLELNNQGNLARESVEEGRDDDDDEEEEEGSNNDEEVETERVIESKPADDTKDSDQEVSEEDGLELNNQGNLTRESVEDRSGDEEEEEGSEEDDDEEEGSEEEEEESDDNNGDEEEEEENLKLDKQENLSTESVEDGSDEEEEEEEGSDDDDDEEEEEQEEDSNEKDEVEEEDSNEEDEVEEECDEERCSSTSDSPAPSLMTSGYGTYRPEEQEGGDYRDDHTITEFDQDSRCDLSEMRDDEEDERSLGGFGEFDIEPSQEPDFFDPPLCLSEDNRPEAQVACCGEDGRREEIEVEGLKPEEGKREDHEHSTSEEQQPQAPETEDTFLMDGKLLEAGDDLRENDEGETQDHHELDNVEREVEDRVESEDPDESSSNKDIRFIDSKADFSWMTYDKMCEEWEGNLRPQKGKQSCLQTTEAASCLEERLAELHLSPSAQQDFERREGSDESDVQSSEADAISLSVFESYIRGMTQTHSDADLRPKPKSFIRPVMSQQTIKKTDPVAKYFQYKQLWDMLKLPGEQDRKALRWEIKERLAYQPPPPKPRRVYVPNTYIVPTEKKRSALRWEIRNDLANGVLPHKCNYRF